MAEISYPADWRDIPPEQFKKMLLTPEQYTVMRAERLAREEMAPEVGQMAPDFTLERLSAAGKRTGEMVVHETAGWTMSSKLAIDFKGSLKLSGASGMSIPLSVKGEMTVKTTN